MPQIEHYLISLYANNNINVHAYCMCDNKEYHIPRVIDKMINDTERNGYSIRTDLPALVTTLSTSKKLVREIVCKNDSAARKNIAAATNYHLTIFAMGMEIPDNERLMALH